MYGKCRQLEDALVIFENMIETRMEIHGYMYLLGNADLIGVATERVLELEPDHCGSYALMSNVFGATGRYGEVAELVAFMQV
ncbi:Pentatricopeptide repeat superfamily protein [Perilla frutescens var. hirtella]|nr:Pentatricopeptide repeat superfamily protein [Perilla frutescens var. hirtella]